jgi:hypothetical protein
LTAAMILPGSAVHSKVFRSPVRMSAAGFAPIVRWWRRQEWLIRVEAVGKHVI